MYTNHKGVRVNTWDWGNANNLYLPIISISVEGYNKKRYHWVKLYFKCFLHKLNKISIKYEHYRQFNYDNICMCSVALSIKCKYKVSIENWYFTYSVYWVLVNYSTKIKAASCTIVRMYQVHLIIPLSGTKLTSKSQLNLYKSKDNVINNGNKITWNIVN